ESSPTWRSGSPWAPPTRATGARRPPASPSTSRRAASSGRSSRRASPRSPRSRTAPGRGARPTASCWPRWRPGASSPSPTPTRRQLNFTYPHAWRYRDYVIAAVNADRPYDQFIREQLAGDLLSADSDDRKAELQIATGFLAMVPKDHNQRNRLQFQLDVVDEQVDATFEAFQGLTVSCARCHDHKFDPIPQRDYYAVAGIFRSTQSLHGTLR